MSKVGSEFKIKTAGRLRYFLIFVSLILQSFPVSAQLRGNLEVMDSLIAGSVRVGEEISFPKGEINLAVNLPGELRFFESRISSAYKALSDKITYNNQRTGRFIVYTLESAAVEYSEKEPDGIFSQRRFERVVTVKYSITGSEDNLLRESATLSFSDIVSEEDIASLGENGYPFTIGKIPEGGVWQNIYEPAIATAASAVIVYLFFTVRNN